MDEVDVDVLRQPRLPLRCGVRGEVVQDDVDLFSRMLFDRLLQEGQGVRGITVRFALTEDFAGGDVQGGEQIRGAVPDVVVGALLNSRRTGLGRASKVPGENGGEPHL
ncbi:hypothetical protein O1M07_33325 [Streptomyces albulus]|nr:hypothetical protein [Streptomyces noursei]MCZ1018963.1 hypothetical protein [Streptomyces noursei]